MPPGAGPGQAAEGSASRRRRPPAEGQLSPAPKAPQNASSRPDRGGCSRTKKKDQEAALKSAGVDSFIYAGIDAVETLTALHKALGV